MKVSGTRMPLLCVVVFLICFASNLFAQNASMAGMVPKSTTKAPIDATKIQPYTTGMILQVHPTPSAVSDSSSLLLENAATTTGTGGTIFGLNTVPTFSGAFAPENSPNVGQVFPFIMVGKDPTAGGATTIPVKATEISLQLLNANNTVNTTVPFTTTFDDVFTDSPNFANALIYNSSAVATQFGDAVQRAEFFNLSKSNWHTKLSGPTIVSHTTWQIPFQVNVQFADGKVEAVRTWFTGTASDGSTFVLLLDLLFDVDFQNDFVNNINLGHFTTNAMNMTWLPNAFLFSANEANPNTPGGCCVLGFHSYFSDGNVPQDRWLTIFSSYISPGLFGGGVQDVTGLSHEISETLNDPFINNATPSWQFPGQPSGSTVCQGNLETGDPVEVLSNPTVAISLTEGTSTLTFHPQTEALLQWFEMGATSNAINGAFSYPNEAVLTAAAKPCGT